MIFLFIPFVLQALAMFFDEFHFHRRRGLPRWERIGHPLDSLTVLICYLFIAVQAPTTAAIYIYAGLSFFSSVFVTKDEFVHSKLCDAKENWLHAFLFILHPITFLCAGIIWKENLSSQFLIIQPAVVVVFMVYQILYWSPFGISKRQS